MTYLYLYQKSDIWKTFYILTAGFREMSIMHKVLEIYEMRQRGEWEVPDLVDDAG